MKKMFRAEIKRLIEEYKERIRVIESEMSLRQWSLDIDTTKNETLETVVEDLNNILGK